MKKVTLKKRWKVSRRLREAGKHFSIDRVFDYCQAALVCVDQGGLCAGLTVSSLMLVSFLLHAAGSGAEKGVI
jgi:hypothetical protein